MSTPRVARPRQVPPLRIPKGSPVAVPKPSRLDLRPRPVAGSLKVQWLCARGYEDEEAPWLVLLEPPNGEPKSANMRVLAAHDGEAEAASMQAPLTRGTARGRWRIPLVETETPARYLLVAEVDGRTVRSCELPVFGKLALQVVDIEGEPVACTFVLRWPGGRTQSLRTDPHGVMPVCEGPAGMVVLGELQPLIPPPEREGEPEPVADGLEQAQAQIEPEGEARLCTHHAYRVTYRGWHVVELAFEPQRIGAKQDVELIARCIGKPPAPLRFELYAWPPEGDGAGSPNERKEPLAQLEAEVRKGEGRVRWQASPPPLAPPQDDTKPSETPATEERDAEKDERGDGERAELIPLAKDAALGCELDSRAVWFVARCEDRETKSHAFARGKLEIWAYLRVRLIDELTDQPLADLELTLIEPDGRERQLSTDGDGVLALEELVRPGFYTIVPKPHPERGTFAAVRVGTVESKSETLAVRLSLAALAPEVDRALEALCREALEALPQHLESH